MTTKLNVTAPRSTQTATGKSVEDFTIEDINALLQARDQKIAAKQAPLEEALNADYARCVNQANEIKAFNPNYKAPWETATPLMLGHAIKDWLAANGGSATTQDIINQFNQFTPDQQIEAVLKSRIKGGKHRLWDYNKSTDTYTVKNNSNSNNN